MARPGQKEEQAAQARAQVLRRSFWAYRQLELVLVSDSDSRNAFASDARISTHSNPSGASGSSYNGLSSGSLANFDHTACMNPIVAIAAMPQKSSGLTVMARDRTQSLNPYARHLQRMRDMRAQEQRA